MSTNGWETLAGGGRVVVVVVEGPVEVVLEVVGGAVVAVVEVDVDVVDGPVVEVVVGFGRVVVVVVDVVVDGLRHLKRRPRMRVSSESSSDPALLHATTKSPSAVVATEGSSCRSLMSVLIWNSSPTGTPALSKPWPWNVR